MTPNLYVFRQDEEDSFIVNHIDLLFGFIFKWLLLNKSVELLRHKNALTTKKQCTEKCAQQGLLMHGKEKAGCDRRLLEEGPTCGP